MKKPPGEFRLTLIKPNDVPRNRRQKVGATIPTALVFAFCYGSVALGVAFASEPAPLEPSSASAIAQDGVQPVEGRDGASPDAAAPDGASAAAGAPTSLPAISVAEFSEQVMRGDLAFAKRDLTAARHFYQIGAEGGDSRAALRLAETYDPNFLNAIQLQSAGDRERAAYWYRWAYGLGSQMAGLMLVRLDGPKAVPAAAGSESAGRSETKPAPGPVSAPPVPVSKDAADRNTAKASPGSTPEKRTAAIANPSPPAEPVLKPKANQPLNAPVVPDRARFPSIGPPLSDRAAPGKEERASEPSRQALSPGELGALLARGDSLLGTGDVTAARLFYERGANAGDGTAALRLGETFDPKFLARARLGFVVSDTDRATHWYRVARQLGNADVEVLLRPSDMLAK
jgi:TPR repeat protein